MSRVRGLPLALAVAAVTIGVDRITKVWAERRLVAGPCRPGGSECIELIGSLRLHLIYNQGAAFSTGTSVGPLFGVVAAVMTVVLLRLAATSTDRLRTVLFGLIAGGAVGNLIDRVARADSGLLSGGVIDFIDAQWWPVFNVADAAVVCGVIVFVVRSMWATPSTDGAPHVAPDHDGADRSATADGADRSATADGADRSAPADGADRSAPADGSADHSLDRS